MALGVWTLVIVLWTVVAFACGSMPLSVWLGEMALTRISAPTETETQGLLTPARRARGDWVCRRQRAKAGVPVSLARFWGGLEGRALVPAPPAPVGHAFAPWLGFRGGKAVAATSGVWSALTLWEGPVTLGACLAGLRLVQAVDAWSVLLGMLGLLVLL